MKYRILQEPHLFTPQYKWLFWWHEFPKVREFMGMNYYSKEAFSSFQEAKDFIDEQIKERQSAKSPTIVHKYP